MAARLGADTFGAGLHADLDHQGDVLLTLASAVALITLVLIGHVRAEPQSRTLYNERGQEIGRSITRGNTTTHKDAMGREIGRSDRRPDGTVNYFNERGQSIGSSRGRR